MSPLEAFLSDLALVFVLVLARVGALVTTAPMMSEGNIPMRVKGWLAVTMAAVVTPMTLHYPTPKMETLADLGAAVALEALVGLSVGLGVMLVLAGVQLTGQIVGQMSGMVLAEGGDPTFTDNATVFGQVFSLVTIAVFATLGGHRLLIESLMGTFDAAPPGFVEFSDQLMRELFALFTMGFEMGVRASAPLMAALFLATLVLGLISRTLPQINTVVVGLSVNAMLAIGMMFVSLGAVAWSFQGPIAAGLENLTAAVQSSETANGANGRE